MTQPRPLPWTRDQLRSFFDYDPETGVITWKIGRRRGFPAGSVGKAGYLYVFVEGKRNVRVHRLIWKWMTNEDPELDVDHIDRNRSNNRWSNLRTLSRADNTRNNGAAHVGIHKASGLWYSRVRVNYRWISFGYYRTRAEAEAAYHGGMKALAHVRQSRCI